jgi:hypothetical protein
MKRETVEAMAANIASMLANIGKLAKLAADEIEACPPHFVRNNETETREAFAARVAQRKAKRGALVSALRTLQNQFPKES